MYFDFISACSHLGSINWTRDGRETAAKQYWALAVSCYTSHSVWSWHRGRLFCVFHLQWLTSALRELWNVAKKSIAFHWLSADIADYFSQVAVMLVLSRRTLRVLQNLVSSAMCKGEGVTFTMCELVQMCSDRFPSPRANLWPACNNSR